MESLETVVNDAGAIINFDKAKEVYMPGRLDSRRDMEKLDEELSENRDDLNPDSTGIDFCA